MKIGIITYKTNHLKTEQIVNIFMQQYSPKDIVMYALPFVHRPTRDVLFEHRPNQNIGVDTEILAAGYGIKYNYCSNGDRDIDNGADIYIITGAGIISEECVKGKKIINCHPGIIPLSRGLDAFKWAINDAVPIGVTLHYIDAKVDFGDIIAVEPTPLFSCDTLQSFARRHYELEIEILSHFEHYLTDQPNEYADAPVGVAHMRMKREVEEKLIMKFEDYKKKYAWDK